MISRDKFLTKRKWAERGISCPGVERVVSTGQALDLVDRFGGPVVLKPPSASGSELTYLCEDKYSAAQAFRSIRASQSGADDSRFPVVAEEYIGGREYSADFICEHRSITIVRIAKKLFDPGLPFGAPIAYKVPARLPGDLDEESLKWILGEAVRAVGLEPCIGMVDFRVNKGEIVLLEVTPRVGGDCLPPLIKQSCGLDTIGMALDFAEGKLVEVLPANQWRELVGLRLPAPDDGRLIEVDVSALKRDPRVREINIRCEPGHEVKLPPEDVDSWVLGYVIFEPYPGVPLSSQCQEISRKATIRVERYYEPGFYRAIDESRRNTQSPGSVS